MSSVREKAKTATKKCPRDLQDLTIPQLKKKLKEMDGLDELERIRKSKEKKEKKTGNGKSVRLLKEDYCLALRRRSRKVGVKRALKVLGSGIALTLLGKKAVQEAQKMQECVNKESVCPVTFTDPKHVRKLYELTRDMLTFFRTKLDQDIVTGGYAACCGTVIGAVRHGGLIPWDDDNDFYVTQTFYDYLKTSEVRDMATKNGYKIDTTFDTGSRVSMMNTHTLKFMRRGGTPLLDPFIDLILVVDTSLKATRGELPKSVSGNIPRRILPRLSQRNTDQIVLTYPRQGLESLKKINPMGNPLNDALLVEDSEWKWANSNSDNPFVVLRTTNFKWYDLDLPVPGNGYKYLRRAFSPAVFTTAVVRIALPGISHKFIDAPGYYSIPKPYAPVMNKDGTVRKRGQAAEMRTRKEWLEQGADPKVVNWWGGDRKFLITKN